MFARGALSVLVDTGCHIDVGLWQDREGPTPLPVTRLLPSIKLSQVQKDGDSLLPIWKRERCADDLIGMKSFDCFPICLELKTVKLRNFLGLASDKKIVLSAGCFLQ